MKNLLTVIILLTGSLLHADYLKDLTKNNRVVIVYGAKAPQEEKDMAQEIYSILELDKCDDLFDHIITDDYLLRFTGFYIHYNLIIIGSKESNRVCNLNQEIQTLYQNNPPSIYNSRYGYYKNPQEIGYIRRMLNPFLLQAYNLSNGKVSASPPTTITFLSGSDSQGVLKACDSFLDAQLLEGFIIPKNQLSSKNSRFKLSKDNLTFTTPKEFNKKFQIVSGDQALKYKGWIQGSLTDYSGFKKLSGVSASQIYHLKFQSAKSTLMTYDDQQNTMMLIAFSDEKQSLKALKGMDKSLRLNLKIAPSQELQIYPCSQADYSWLLIRKGKFLIIENINSAWKDKLAQNAEKIFVD